MSGNHITVKGPKATLQGDLHPEMSVAVQDGVLTRSLIANMVQGVTEGFSKVLEIQGVGYRATSKGNNIELAVGYSHPVPVAAPEGITFTVETPTRVIVSGADKQLVGQIAADIRAHRPPDPYKGKGIRYEGEYVRRKAGKAAK